MGDGRSTHPALLTPRPSIEDPRESRKHNISPVEVHRALIEVRQPEENSRHQQGPALPQTALQKILHPPAKEKLLRNRNKKEREDPGQHDMRNGRNIGVV